MSSCSISTQFDNLVGRASSCIAKAEQDHTSKNVSCLIRNMKRLCSLVCLQLCYIQEDHSKLFWTYWSSLGAQRACRRERDIFWPLKEADSIQNMESKYKLSRLGADVTGRVYKVLYLKGRRYSTQILSVITPDVIHIPNQNTCIN